MKNLFKQWLLQVYVLGLTMCLPFLSRAQEGDTLMPYQGAYQIYAHCLFEGEGWVEEYDSFIMNLEAVSEEQRIYRFYLPLLEINDYVEIKLKPNDTGFKIPRQLLPTPGDTTNITSVGGNGALKNDSIFMNFYMANTYIEYGVWKCDCKGARPNMAIESALTEHSNASWQLSPQPAGGTVQAVCIDAEPTWQKGRWYLHDLSGKRLLSGNFTDGRFEVALSSVPQGVYLIEVRSAQGGAVCRLKCVKGL